MFQNLQIQWQTNAPTVEQAEKPDAKGDEIESIYFLATLFEYPLVAWESGTETVKTNLFLGEASSSIGDTFAGEIEGFEFALIKQEQTKDLQVHLRSKNGYGTLGEEADWRKFYALMNALAFVHGVHAWPSRERRQKDFRQSSTCGAARA
jgi:hypothetical protein